ncbi:MAG TPA: archaeosine biosynthesis radical SAM protein RaSEA [Thermoplasmata archaeon]|nr:archaeosine biosynthesis radical SAM protein RaSEA [Thermoplasmata archaeon]
MNDAGAGGRDRRRRKDKDAAVAVWKEKEVVDGKAVDAGVIILRTSGCSHFHSGGCSMCGYNIESDRSISEADIVKQFGDAMTRLGEVGMVKVYTSGSFLDEREMPAGASSHIVKECADRGARLLIESRPEYITGDSMSRMLAVHDDIELAIGLESANDKVLKHSINKGFTVADYDRAATLMKENGVDLRTYILLKPPFLTEKEAVEDAVATAEHAAPFSYSMSVNAVNVQKGTLVERLWKDWSYRPPWLWSVLEVAGRCAGLGPKLLCDPTGGGTQRGAHNCGECDQVILEGLKAFTSSQQTSRLAKPACSCGDMYSTLLELEGKIVGGTPDLNRFFRR